MWRGTVGQWAGKGRAMAREFQRALEDMAREAELDKVKSEIEKAGRTDLGKTIEKRIDPSGELSKAFDPPVLGAAGDGGASRRANGGDRGGDRPASKETAAGASGERAAAPRRPRRAKAGRSGWQRRQCARDQPQQWRAPLHPRKREPSRAGAATARRRRKGGPPPNPDARDRSAEPS